MDLSLPIQCLELSVRADNCLHMGGIYTVAQLCCQTEEQLCGMPGFGKTCLREVRRKLQDRGLSLNRCRKMDWLAARFIQTQQIYSFEIIE